MDVRVTLLGGFDVAIDDRPLPAGAWSRRHAAHLVKLLALAPRHRMHREQVIDTLWPEVDPFDAAPRLHKAAHYARRAMGHAQTLVLTGDTVLLCPDGGVSVDAVEFEAQATAAVTARDPQAAARAADLYRGTLLPADPYEEWLETHRDRLHLLHLDVLRLAGRWAALVDADPTDEEAHLTLARAAMAEGDHAAALRQLERLERALQRELGTAPSRAVLTLRRELLDKVAQAPAEPGAGRGDVPVGRAAEVARLDRLLTEVRGGAGQVLFVSGRRGVGTSTMLLCLQRRAAARGMRVGVGIAAQVEAQWPYAPVLEALSDLCRRNPELLDQLDRHIRTEIDRALSGRELSWDGSNSHQRLYVAVAELLRLAAAGTGAALLIDDADEADDASLRLLHYLARATTTDRVLIALAHDDAPSGPLADVRASLFARDQGRTLELAPLTESDATALVRAHVTDPELVSALVEAGGGVPLLLVESARAAARGRPDPLHALLPGGAPVAVLDALGAVALLGTTFDADELAAASGLEIDKALAVVEDAVALDLLTRTATGASFRHTMIRDGLLRRLQPARRREVHLRTAQALAGAPPDQRGVAARVAHHLLEAGSTTEAVPWVLRSAETHAAVGAYQDALAELDTVRDAAAGGDLDLLLTLRADLFMACAHPDTLDAYREALAHATDPAETRRLRVRMGKAAVLAGDLGTAAIALDGLLPTGEDQQADAELLMARGHLHLFAGELDEAQADADLARRQIALTPRSPGSAFDLVAFDGLLAHFRGEWYHRLHAELRRGVEQPEVTRGIFDSHLCVAEYLLYGPTPYGEIIELANGLRDTARRAGVLRAVAFATALSGEAAMLQGDLATAERELNDAVLLHRQIGSAAGEAHSLQRLAETRLAAGDAAEARRLLALSLHLARWSSMAPCLLPRIYGTQVAAAPDPAAARAEVDQAMAALGPDDQCYFCSIMLDLPAARAYADAGDVAAAQRHLAAAEPAAARWNSTGWDAAVLEARAHLAAADGDGEAAAGMRQRAAEMFMLVGQELDAQRCRA